MEFGTLALGPIGVSVPWKNQNVRKGKKMEKTPK